MGNAKYSKEELRTMAPVEIRSLIRAGEIDEPTCGMADGYAQGNLVILPKEYAYDFLLYAQRNPKPCPILEVSDAGSRSFVQMGEDSDIAKDFPRYRIYEYGKMTGEYTDVSSFWRDDFVSFLIGCSFSFEADLLENNVPVRQIEEGRNVPMYDTSIPCQPAGVFHGNMVVSMRPDSVRTDSKGCADHSGNGESAWSAGNTLEIRKRSVLGILINRIRGGGNDPPRRDSGFLGLRCYASECSDPK